VQAAQVDVDGESGGVLSHTVEFEANSHGTCTRISEILGAVLGVDFPQALRQQDFDGEPEEFVVGIAEELLRLVIDHDDDAAGLDDDQTIRCGVEQGLDGLMRKIRIAPVGSSQIARLWVHLPPIFNPSLSLHRRSLASTQAYYFCVSPEELTG
jgi:hypothetical protein